VVSVSARVHDTNPQLPVDGKTRRSRRRPTVYTTPPGRRLATLSLTALGVVYGDIGTSPLYAFRACFNPKYGLSPTVLTVYGVLSLIVWSLILVVSVKYLIFVMRLDNRPALRRRRHHPGHLRAQRG
jgi:hypothetical protein